MTELGKLVTKTVCTCTRCRQGRGGQSVNPYVLEGYVIRLKVLPNGIRAPSVLRLRNMGNNLNLEVLPGRRLLKIGTGLIAIFRIIK